MKAGHLPWALALVPLVSLAPVGHASPSAFMAYQEEALPLPEDVAIWMAVVGMPEDAALPDPAPRPVVHAVLHTVNDPQETLEIDLPLDGMVTEAQDAELKHFFRCRYNGREKSVAATELALLADLAVNFPGRQIEVISAYRTPPYGVKHSKHYTGHAIDLRVEGVKLSVVRDTLWREHHGIGLGYYLESNFIHLDDRAPGDAEMAWTSTSEGAPYQYHPYWAEKIRDQQNAFSAYAVGGTARGAR